MKTHVVALGLAVAVVCNAVGDGRFMFVNSSAPTRMYSIEGPLAGPGIWGQMLVGMEADMLTPVGVPVEHRPDGTVFGGIVNVPGIPSPGAGFGQMVAWDGRLWGTSLGGVPLDQLGKTDIVLLRFSDPLQPVSAPVFSHPAIVPVPEPCVIALAVLGASIVWLSRGSRSRPKLPRWRSNRRGRRDAG